MITRLSFRHVVLGLAALALSLGSLHAQPQSGASVYLLQMRYGFDLYLANQLTQANALTVVTDPSLAQYILTDSVGSGFERTLEALYPKPKPEEPKEEAKSEEKGDKEKNKMDSMVAAYANTTRHTSSFSRAEGTIFLVDRTSRAVLWSTYLDRKDSRGDAMNKDAGQIVKRLVKAMKEAAPVSAGNP